MRDGFYDSPEWLAIRYRVLQKSDGCCKLCGCRGISSNPIHIDHIKPRSLYPELQLVESNLQVLCKACNLGKSNKDSTDWRFKASRELVEKVNRKAAILAHATPEQRGKLEQLGWLARNDPSFHKEAEKQYQAIWLEVEADWISQGEPQ